MRAQQQLIEHVTSSWIHRSKFTESAMAGSDDEQRLLLLLVVRGV